MQERKSSPWCQTRHGPADCSLALLSPALRLPPVENYPGFRRVQSPFSRVNGIVAEDVAQPGYRDDFRDAGGGATQGANAQSIAWRHPQVLKWSTATFSASLTCCSSTVDACSDWLCLELSSATARTRAIP